MSGYGRNPFGATPSVPIDDGRAERQAAAEFREAIGQLNQAGQLYFGYGANVQGYADYAGQSRKHLDQTSKELAAHKIREAITNLQDVVRFMELP